MWEESKNEIFLAEFIQYPNLNYTEEFKKSYKKIERDKKVMVQATLAKVAGLYLDQEISALKKDGGIQYEDYTSFRIKNKPLGHFRVNQSLRINSFEWKGKLHLLEFGEHIIEENISCYKNSIIKIMEL